MSKTNLSRRKPQVVAETISARRGRCALYALVRVHVFDANDSDSDIKNPVWPQGRLASHIEAAEARKF